MFICELSSSSSFNESLECKLLTHTHTHTPILIPSSRGSTPFFPMLFHSLGHPLQPPKLNYGAAMLFPPPHENAPLLMEPSLLELVLPLAIEPYQACTASFLHPIDPYSCPINLWSPLPPIPSSNGNLATHTHTHTHTPILLA